VTDRTVSNWGPLGTQKPVRGTQTVHIITYTCEQCGAEHTRATGLRNDGMCTTCGFPMRIDDLFSDRRIASLPVLLDRRVAVEREQAA
jgi:hypothetical protein